LKQAEIDKLNDQIDELRKELDEQKSKHRKQVDAKDVEINSLKLNLENARLELANSQKEHQQMKTRFETLRVEEKTNAESYARTMRDIEKENEKLNDKCLDLTKKCGDSVKQAEAVKSQLIKYEQLIDNLNEQVSLMKGELKETKASLGRASAGLNMECELRTKFEAKCKELEVELAEKKSILSRHENCEPAITDLNNKLKQLAQTLTKK
jgi:chromosome segregation ATPase